MKIEQLYTGCLSQGTYYVECNGQAAVIDPLREVDQYVQMAAERGATIRYIFETHFHADFVSGHVDLSRKTGAPIIYGPTATQPGFDCIVAHDGQQFPLGDATITLIHTPGHTLESSCYLLADAGGTERALFTGDTLFIGDVGRPDLAQQMVADLTQQKLASMLYDSLREKIMPLNDDITVYPAHGAGSACGKNMSRETFDTLGNQKKNNYALRPELTREQFTEEVLTGLTPPPGYFPKNVLMNIQGYDSIDEVIQRGTTPVPADQFRRMLEQGDVLILDTRNPEEFAAGFIPGSLNISLNGTFAVWVGTLVPDIRQKLLIIADEGREEEAIIRLARVGYDNTLGFLQGGFQAWTASGLPTGSMPVMTTDQFAEARAGNPGIHILDVRRKTEYDAGHIHGAENMPLDYIHQNAAQIDPQKTYYVHCAAGFRSMTFASILKSKGYDKLINIAGGFNALRRSGRFRIDD